MSKTAEILNDYHCKLVQPICALEEYIQCKETDAIVSTIAFALRHILNEMEQEVIDLKH